MRQIRQSSARLRQSLAEGQASRNVTTSASTNRSGYQYPITTATTTSSSSESDDLGTLQPTATATEAEGSPDNPKPLNPCVLCLTEEKRLACIPCGHLATCVPCGQSLKSCSICRREIEAFVRVYI
jgi:hypothetical protein